MRTYLRLIWFLPLLFIMSCSTPKVAKDNAVENEGVHQQTEPSLSPAFILGPCDEMNISVWRNDDLNKNVQIDPSGNIYLPLIGKIHASGMTVSQLRQSVTLKLSKYIINPKVAINISAARNQKIFILGEIHIPGSLPLDHKMLVWEAIAKSGGFTADANQKSVLLVRIKEGVPHATALNLNIRDMAANETTIQPIHLENSDILYVPPLRIANFERFMSRLNNIISPFVSIERAIVLGPQVIDALQGKTTGDVIVPP